MSSLSADVHADPLSVPPRGGLHVSLWIAQALLGALFFALGATKLSQPLDQLQAMGMTFVARTPEALVRFIGLSEALGGLGLILPAATRVLPRLTGVAAALLALVMVLGAGEHAVHGELDHAPASLVLGGLLVFVAWGRLVRAPIPARS